MPGLQCYTSGLQTPRDFAIDIYRRKGIKMTAKKKSAKKPTPKKSVAKAPSKNKSRNTNIKKEGKIMNEETQNTSLATLDARLASIDAKLGELVQIETYLATKAFEASKTVIVPAASAAAPVPQPASVPAIPAPAQQPAVAPRPGQGTVGGLVWDCCDGLTRQLGRAPSKNELIAAIKQFSPTFNGQPLNELTAATQYSKWRSFSGLPRLPRGFAASKPASTPVPTSNVPVGAIPSFVPSQPAPVQLPLPAARVPSVIAPTATPSAGDNLPPWLRAGTPST
jgi:hypothetical protein